jgi:hypothetical protein
LIDSFCFTHPNIGITNLSRLKVLQGFSLCWTNPHSTNYKTPSLKKPKKRKTQKTTTKNPERERERERRKWNE